MKVRDALELVRSGEAAVPQQPAQKEWLQRLGHLRASVGTGSEGASTEEILDDLRSEHRA